MKSIKGGLGIKTKIEYKKEMIVVSYSSITFYTYVQWRKSVLGLLAIQRYYWDAPNLIVEEDKKRGYKNNGSSLIGSGTLKN
jgi:hypothetical protein